MKAPLSVAGLTYSSVPLEMETGNVIWTAFGS